MNTKMLLHTYIHNYILDIGDNSYRIWFPYCALLGEMIEGSFPATAALLAALLVVVGAAAAVAGPAYSRFKQFGSRQVFDPGVLQQLQPCL